MTSNSPAKLAIAPPTSISGSVVTFLSSCEGIQGIDIANLPGVAVEDLVAWEEREHYALPEGEWI